MAILVVLVGLLAAVAAGAVLLFTVGAVAAVVGVVAILALVGVALFVVQTIRTVALAALGVVLVVALGFGGLSAYQLYSGLADFNGPADAADPAALASATAKMDAAKAEAGFRVELTQQELGAVLQDALVSAEDNPIRRVDLTVVDGEDGEPGVIDFAVTFKNGSLSGDGRVGAKLDAGELQIEVHEVSLGRLSLPGVATGAMEELIKTVLDLNDRLAESRADVQAVEIGGGRVLVVGTTGGGAVLTSGSLLSAIAQNAESLAGAVTPPAETVAVGTVNGTTAEGARYIVALGDSLAANVGVSVASQGYVSRFHREVSERDGTTYGLRNFGISGETSGSLIRGGQLEEALSFIRANDVAYITIDIGANDLLGHLGSGDCSESLQAPACQARLQPTLQTYRANLDRILRDLDGAADGATVVFLTTYNPFSLGFGGDLTLEVASNEATVALNAVAQEVAGTYGVLVADGATPLRGTTAATTLMLQSPPDIHPNAIGYSLLAQALLDALP